MKTTSRCQWNIRTNRLYIGIYGTIWVIKINNYLFAGTTIWLVNPETQQIEVYQPNQKALILNIEDTLSGDPHLKGFTLSVKNIFEI